MATGCGDGGRVLHLDDRALAFDLGGGCEGAFVDAGAGCAGACPGLWGVQDGGPEGPGSALLGPVVIDAADGLAGGGCAVEEDAVIAPWAGAFGQRPALWEGVCVVLDEGLDRQAQVRGEGGGLIVVNEDEAWGAGAAVAALCAGEAQALALLGGSGCLEPFELWQGVVGHKSGVG